MIFYLRPPSSPKTVLQLQPKVPAPPVGVECFSIESNTTQSVNLNGCESDGSSSATTLPSFEMNLLQQTNWPGMTAPCPSSTVERRAKFAQKESKDSIPVHPDSPQRTHSKLQFNVNDVNIDEMYKSWKSSPSTFNFASARTSIAGMKTTWSKPVGALSQFIGNRRSMNVEEIGSIEACLNAVGLKCDDFLSPSLKRTNPGGFGESDSGILSFSNADPLPESNTSLAGEVFGQGSQRMTSSCGPDFLNYESQLDSKWKTGNCQPEYTSGYFQTDNLDHQKTFSSVNQSQGIYNLDNNGMYDNDNVISNSINSWIQYQGEVQIETAQQSSSTMHAWPSDDASMSSVSITENVSVVAAAGTKVFGGKTAANLQHLSDDTKSSMCSSSDNSNRSGGAKQKSGLNSTTRIRTHHINHNGEVPGPSTTRETGLLMNKGGMMLWQKVQNCVVVGAGLVNSANQPKPKSQGNWMQNN